MDPYYQDSYATGGMSNTAKAALLGIGGLVGWRGLTGVKRALTMSKLGKHGLKNLDKAQKLELLKKVKGPGYQAYAKKQMGL